MRRSFAFVLLVSSALAFDPTQNAPLDDEFEPIIIGGKRYDTTYYTDPSKPGRGDREVKRGDSATVHVVAKIRDTGRVIMNTREAGMVPYAGVFGANGVIEMGDSDEPTSHSFDHRSRVASGVGVARFRRGCFFYSPFGGFLLQHS